MSVIRTLQNEAKANPNLKQIHPCEYPKYDKGGSTLMHIAAARGKDEVVRGVITEFSIDPNCVEDNSQVRNVLMLY